MKNCIGTTKASRTLPQAIYCSVKFSSRSNNLQNSSGGALLKLVYTFRLRFFRTHCAIDLMKHCQAMVVFNKYLVLLKGSF